MKRFYTVFILLLLVSCKKETVVVNDDLGEQKFNDLAFYNLKGNVKEMSEKTVEADQDKEGTVEDIASKHLAPLYNLEVMFSKAGNVISEKRYLKNGTIFEEFTYKSKNQPLTHVQYNQGVPGINTKYTWDEKNENDNIIITRRNNDNTQIDKVQQLFENGKIVEIRRFNNRDLLTDKTGHVYDNRGNVIEKIDYLNFEKPQFKTVYEYNDDNNLVSETKYDKAGNVLYKTVSDYDNKLLIKTETLNADGSLEYSKEMKYDDKGNTVFVSVYDKFSDRKIQDEFEYDDKGNKIKVLKSENGSHLFTTTYSYDEHNNLKIITVTDNSSEITENIEYEYEYDNKGNWVRKSITLNGVLKYIVERTITYF